MAEAEVEVLTGVKGGAQGHVEGSISGCGKCGACRESISFQLAQMAEPGKSCKSCSFHLKQLLGAFSMDSFSASCVALEQCQQGHLTLHQRCIVCVDCELMG